MDESEEDSTEIIEDLERLIEHAASHREQIPGNELDPVGRDHVETIRQQSQ